MKIGGLQKTTLIDYPGKVACTVFLSGCNFRCPFCHNRELVERESEKAGKLESEEFFEFLKKRKGILDGVCVTGGEPLMQNDIFGMLKRIKLMGFDIKLDTNGSWPERLKRVIEEGLVDYLAVDIKARWEDYGKAMKGGEIHESLVKKIKKSIGIILKSKITNEFRTTVVPGIHNSEGLIELAKELKEMGVENWVLQKFRSSPNCLDKKYRKMEGFTDEQMEGFLEDVKKYLPGAKLR